MGRVGTIGRRFIEVVLHEYLATMGIIDTVIQESTGGCWDYDERPFFKVEYFRITRLGAYVLGMTEEYEYKEQIIKSGFTVEESSQIKVMNQLSNQVHKIFFEGFADKEEYPEYCMFKISFDAIAKALDKGITVESIVEYIREYSYNGLTTELNNLLLRWKNLFDKVVIKNVIIVQAADKELIEELKNDTNLKKYMVDDLSCAFQIRSDSISKVKRGIQKKEYYCKLLHNQ